MPIRFRAHGLAAAAIALATIASPAPAQQAPSEQQPAAAPSIPEADSAAPTAPDAPRRPSLVPPGVVIGPGMVRERAIRRMCDPRTLGFDSWRIEPLEEALKLSEEQKGKLGAIRVASEKALAQFISNCPRELPLTPTGRLEMLEERLSAMLEAVKTLRGAFDAFYASLSDEQKAHLTPDDKGRGWRFERENEGRRERRRR